MKTVIAAVIKRCVCYAIAILLWVLASPAKAQQYPKVLDSLVYHYNNALQYDSTRLTINNFLQQKNITNADRFYAYLYMSFTYKRLQDYKQVHQYLDIAIGYGLQTAHKDFFTAYYNCQKSFAYFDVNDYVRADSLMQPLIASNYRYLEDDDKGKVMIQEAFMLLRSKQYTKAASMYKDAEIFMQQYSPCELPIVYANEIQLYEANKQFDKMEECYKKGMACADSCGILKYKMLCTQNMYFFYRKNSNYERAIYFAHAWDSMNLIFKTNENLQKLSDVEHLLKEKTKEETINNQNNIILKNKLDFNWLIIFALLLACIIIGMVFYREKKYVKIKRRQRMIFSRQLYEKIEEERQRIASDLHDGVSHELLTLKNNHSQTITSQQNNIDDIIENLRNISRNLHPVMFERLGLKASIEQLVERIQTLNVFYINTDLHYSGQLHKTTEMQLYRMIQEACSNIIKHSNAVAGRISIIEDSKMVITTIEDNGKGFDVNKKLNSSDSFGLHNIIQRAKSLGGKATIVATAKGTIITISIPKIQ
jgi:signal transduction histidine kinase